MYDDCLFAWWTDLPFLKLSVARDLIASVSGLGAKLSLDWRVMSRPVRFPRFEMLSYHVWCVLHEGYELWDVTHLTNETSWGSFLEVPQPGARLAELEPMWIGADALVMVRQTKVGPLSLTTPPLLVFHVDHAEDHFVGSDARKNWGSLLMWSLPRKK